jgi:hypothetical protein
MTTTNTRRAAVRQPAQPTAQQARTIAMAATIHRELTALVVRNGDNRRLYDRLVLDRREAVVTARDQGCTLAMIAVGMGISRQRVHGIAIQGGGS